MSRPQRHGDRAHAGDGLRVTVSAEPRADPLAARACGGETCQDGVREGDQDRAGEVAGRGAGGREDEAGGHCRFQKDQESRAVQGDNGEAGEAPSMPKAVQGRRMQRDSLRGRGAWLLLLAHRRHGCLPGQGAHVYGHQGRVFNVPSVASEEEVAQTFTSGRTSGRTSCKKLGQGNLGREARSPRTAVGSHVTQERGTGPSVSSSSSSLKGSNSSSSNATSTIGG
jgi:hypothetical protein